jgi:hypothetical protein
MAVGFTEAVVPDVDESGGDPPFDRAGKGGRPDREELCAVVECGVADPAGRKPTSRRSSPLEHGHVDSRGDEFSRGNEPGEARADDDDPH